MGNVSVHQRDTKRFRCTMCSRTWVESSNSLHYKLQHSPSKVERVLSAVEEGMSVRQAAKHFSVSPSTVQRWKDKARAQKRAALLTQFAYE